MDKQERTYQWANIWTANHANEHISVIYNLQVVRGNTQTYPLFDTLLIIFLVISFKLINGVLHLFNQLFCRILQKYNICWSQRDNTHQINS